MKLLALDIPDDPAELAGWLERHVVGLDLAAVVGELSAVNEAGGAAPITLDDLMGELRGAVLEEGLSSLPPGPLGRLLRQPRLLLDLQEQVFLSGGEHWRRLAHDSRPVRDLVDRLRPRIETIPAGKGTSPTGDRTVLPIEPAIARRRRPWVIGLAAAASLLIAVFAYRRASGPTVVARSVWGWERPGALSQDVPPAAYLDRLADAAREWFEKRPDQPASLTRRLREFRRGCSVLIAAEHRPLSAADRSWLVEKCRSWATKLDAHLAAVEAGGDPIRVRTAADETINKLISALRERAKAVI